MFDKLIELLNLNIQEFQFQFHSPPPMSHSITKTKPDVADLIRDDTKNNRLLIIK